ncbi:hypothetical protein GW17_00018444 [Ensete ventricosum]|nr:hypothetical protein GW17_00018444 [Ensete ventricosum]
MRSGFAIRPSSAPLLTADQPLLRRSRGTINRPIRATTPSPFLRLTTALAVRSDFQPDEARVPAALQLPVPPVSKFKIALCQLLVTPDKERNIARARKAIEEAAGRGAQLVLLPVVYAEDIEGVGDAAPSFSMLSEAARSLQITIIGGSIPERSGDRLYNTCCVFGTDGKLLGAHLLCYPGAFNITTGSLLWELMQRARAADNQVR